MTDTPPAELPPVYQGELDDERLSELIHDLRTCADVQQVLVRTTESAASTPVDRRVEFDHLADMFARGVVANAQIRYRYQNEQWCDTLLVRNGGVRLVRMQHNHLDR